MKKDDANEEIRKLRHRILFVKIDLENVKRDRDECKRQKDAWRQSALELAGKVKDKKIRGVKTIFNNFPKC